MMAEVSLQTERIDIVPFSNNHITESYLSWLNDKSLMKYSEQRYYLHTKASSENYLSSFSGSPNYFWALLDRQNSGALIGSMTAYIDENNNIADIGIMLGSKRRRRSGMAFEAWCTVQQWLLNDLGIRKVTAGTLAVNKAMIAIMKKSGMIGDGVRKSHYINEGIAVDVIYMALFDKRNGG